MEISSLNPWTSAGTTVLVVLLISGCSDPSTQNTTTVASEEINEFVSQAPLELLPLTGTLVIDERSGKRIIDAYFTRYESEDITRDTLWADAGNVCFESETIDDAPQPDTSTSLKLERAVERIEISSRAGNYVMLFPQQLEETVVYASDALWQDDGLPEDALLSLTVSPGFTSVQGIRLSPLPPLERLSPMSGQLTSGEDAVRWQVESGSDTDADIRLHLTGIPTNQAGSTDKMLTRVDCVLEDDGAFDVPAPIRVAMGDPMTMNVSVARYRERIVSGVDGDLRIVQRSQN